MAHVLWLWQPFRGIPDNAFCEAFLPCLRQHEVAVLRACDRDLRKRTRTRWFKAGARFDLPHKLYDDEVGAGYRQMRPSPDDVRLWTKQAAGLAERLAVTGWCWGSGLTMSGSAAMGRHIVISIFESCPGLKRAELSFIGVSDAVVQALARNCRGLRDVAVGQCEGYRDYEAHITDASVMALADNCRGLQKASFRSDDWQPNPISDSAISRLAQKCNGLREINLECCSVGNTSLSQLAVHCPSLLRVVVRSYRNEVGDDGVRALAGRCRKLREVRFETTGVSDVSVAALAESCPNLRVIEFRKSGSSGVGQTGQIFANLALNCSELCEVNLEGSVDVADAAIIALARFATKLQQLHFGDEDGAWEGPHVYGVTDAAIWELAQPGHVPHLRQLEHHCCNLITVGAAEVFRERKPKCTYVALPDPATYCHICDTYVSDCGAYGTKFLSLHNWATSTCAGSRAVYTERKDPCNGWRTLPALMVQPCDECGWYACLACSGSCEVCGCFVCDACCGTEDYTAKWPKSGRRCVSCADEELRNKPFSGKFQMIGRHRWPHAGSSVSVTASTSTH